jgi:hypothetical protein
VSTDTNPIIQPPAALLTAVTNPNTEQTDYAFPLQTDAWLKMQAVVKTAIAFPLSAADFTNLYGTFTDEGSVESAVAILGAIQKTAAEYGDPQTLISELPQFQKANQAPASIYGHAVWLAAQTQTAAQQIGSLLQEGLTDIGTESDPNTRLNDLTELLTGQGGVNSYANALSGYIQNFEKVVSAFYLELNNELTGNTNSLKTYLNSANNVYKDAQGDVSADQTKISQLNSDIKQLNDEYIGFTVAGSVAPLIFLFPLFGPFLAIADAATFGVLATKVSNELGGLRDELKGVSADEQKKTALVTQLQGFNLSAQDVEGDGTAFLDTISKLSGGWTEFSNQITLRLQSLTVQDLQDWGAFMQKINFQSAVKGWGLISSKAETFFQTGLVQFDPPPASFGVVAR